MGKICYIPKTFSEEKMAMIEKINEIVGDYSRQGFNLTLRQLYYQFVSKDAFPPARKYVLVDKKWILSESGTCNAEPNYDWLGDILNDARLAGLVDWDAIVDRTRHLRHLTHYDHPADPILGASKSFNFWKWEDQSNYVEVWVEKDALLGIVEQACDEYDVPFFSCRGYTSVSEIHSAALRFRKEMQHGKTIRVIHLGDHDPSGIDMTRDIAERLGKVFRVPAKIHRIALNRDQIDKYNPPPNPAKATDSRHKGYVAEHGEYSWELDALDPGVLVRLIQANILHWMDRDKFDAISAKQDRARAILGAVHTRWNEVYHLVKHEPERE